MSSGGARRQTHAIADTARRRNATSTCRPGAWADHHQVCSCGGAALSASALVAGMLHIGAMARGNGT